MLSRPVLSWALYDFANTIFAFAVTSRYFSEWIVDDNQRGKPDWWFGAMSFAVAVALVLTLPPAGAIADRYGRRKPFLIAFTLLSVAMTALLGVVGSTLLALVVGGTAIFAFQSALIHYDPMLADVAPEERRGRVSGLGAGLGYIGALVAAGILVLIVPENDNQRAFLPTAAMFLLFALPCFVFVRERARRRVADRPAAVALAALGQLRETMRHARRYRDIGRFLIARFLYYDAVATVIAFTVPYADRIGDLSSARKTALLVVAISCAAVGAFGAGAAVERVGPKRPLIAMLLLFCAALVFTAAAGSVFSLWIAGPAIGLTLGTLAACDRIFMLRLTPPSLRGEFFGLFAITSKLSSGLGPLLIWGGTIWLLSDGLDVTGKTSASRIAIFLFAITSMAGILTLRPLSDAQREWETET
ncbi:MAG TPA: MFS transporter [Gaiellaceae bacterium]|nr:MFS transporter [Gaiellaceae bacterium]